jgi:ATP-dependent DNA helicase RecQ
MNTDQNQRKLESALSILQHYWGFNSLRPNQEPIVRKVLAGESLLALLPTGGGKSICFQLPGLYLPGLTVVISPLIALMEDQVANLRSRGIPAAVMHSGLADHDIAKIFSQCFSDEVKFLYVSPERLHSERFRVAISRISVALVAVDEAHCISQWGHDFRPDYQRISDFLSLIPGAQVIALTASATVEVINDILTQLRLPENAVIRSSFARENLAYRVQRTENKSAAVLRVCREFVGAGILYCQTRGECIRWSEYLTRCGVKAAAYHAGLSYEVKMATYEEWLSGRIQLVCATSAFGMGIDKPDVRFVLHVQMPLQPEAYFQEAGRAGRDGAPAFSTIFWNEEDCHLALKRLRIKYPESNEVERCYQEIYQYCGISPSDKKNTCYRFDAMEFCRDRQIDPWLLQGSLKILESAEWLTLDAGSMNFSKLKIIAQPEKVRNFLTQQCPDTILLSCLLGMYGRLFENMIPVNEYALAEASKMNVAQLRLALKRLASDGWILYDAAVMDSSIRILRTDLQPQFMPKENANAERLRMREFARAEFMKGYIHNNHCRGQQLLEYFGEMNSICCGVCDVCLAQDIADRAEFAEFLKRILKHHSVPLKEIKSLLFKKGWRKEYGFWLRELMDDGSFLLCRNQSLELRNSCKS